MQFPTNGSSGGRNGHRFAPPTETVPPRAGGRSAPPGDGMGSLPVPGQNGAKRRRRLRRPRREDLGAVAKGARETWRSILRVMGLVWATSPKLTIALAGATLLQRITPAAQVWLAGRLIDEVVAGVQAGGDEQHVRVIVILAVIQLALLLGSSFLQTAGNISQQLLQERLAIHIQLQIMRHASTLDLVDFENAAYYDQLQQAQRESANRPVQMVAQVFGLARSVVTFGTLLALLVGLG